MRLVAILLVSLTALTALAASAQGSTPTRLFVSGHSLVDQPLPSFLAAVAASRSTPLDWNRQYVVGSSLRQRTRGAGDGAGWAGYASGDNREGSGLDVVAELRQRPYDLLLITEQHSLLDGLVFNDSVRYLRHYHDRFIDGNAGGRSFFYEPWLDIPNGRADVRRWIDYEREASPVWQCMVARINASLAAEGRADRLRALPAASALAELVEQATSAGGLDGLRGPTPADTVALIFHDTVHLTRLGAYYMALYSFAAMFERSPEGAWAPEGLTPQQAAALQRVAAEAARKHPARVPGITAAGCAERLQGDFVGRYLDHQRDTFWAQQREQLHPARVAWRRFKSIVRMRWALWRGDPLAWDRVADRSYWFPAP